MLGKYLCHNGQFIPVVEGKISVDNIELSYGFGVYENLKVREGKIYFVEEHIERLFNSAKLIGLKHNFIEKEMIKWLASLIVKNKIYGENGRTIETANIKMLLIGGDQPDLYMFCLSPKFLDKKYYKRGVKVITYNYERFLPAAKTLNMLPSYLIYKKATEAKAHDALLIDKNGNITEGTRSNFFAIKNKTLFTAPVEQVLDGVTRRTVIDCARQNGYEVIEQDIKLSEIINYDGAFLTHTSGKIVPIIQINEQKFVGLSVELGELIKLYNDYLEKKRF